MGRMGGSRAILLLLYPLFHEVRLRGILTQIY